MNESFSHDALNRLFNSSGPGGTTSIAYDANGNMTSRGGAAISWSSYNLPISINSPGGYSSQFAYAPDRSRWRQVSTYAGGTETTIYVGGLREKLTTASRTHWKHLIETPSGQVQVIRRSDGTSETLYVTTDHLGSTDAVLDAAGAVVMRGSFGAYGERRRATGRAHRQATSGRASPTRRAAATPATRCSDVTPIFRSHLELE